jgi:hypothetical protein
MVEAALTVLPDTLHLMLLAKTVPNLATATSFTMHTFLFTHTFL